MTAAHPDGPAGPVELLVRDFDQDALVSLRHQVQNHAERHGLTGLALYRFVVAVNEITTNAVRHGAGRGRLSLWQSDGRLVCRVSDQGPGMPQVALSTVAGWPSPYAANGRGLRLARAGAGLDVTTGAAGTVVTLTGPPTGRDTPNSAVPSR